MWRKIRHLSSIRPESMKFLKQLYYSSNIQIHFGYSCWHAGGSPIVQGQHSDRRNQLLDLRNCQRRQPGMFIQQHHLQLGSELLRTPVQRTSRSKIRHQGDKSNRSFLFLLTFKKKKETFNRRKIRRRTRRSSSLGNQIVINTVIVKSLSNAFLCLFIYLLIFV